LIYLKNKNFL
jgi:hypothetical protein